MKKLILSNEFLDELTEWEGSRYKVYLDSSGFPTIGVGHLLTRSERSSGKIYINGESVRYENGLLKCQISSLFNQDLKRFIRVVDMNCKKLNQRQKEALVSFCFNVGVKAFKNSTLLRRIKNNNIKDVPSQLRRWNRAGGQVVHGLINRREKEIQWFLS